MTLLESIRGTFTGDDGASMDKLREELQQQQWQGQLLEEDLRMLELTMEDQGWREMSGKMQREFTRGGLENLMKLSRAMYLSHPLIQRSVNVRSYYTWGQGVNIKADDESVQKKVIDEMHKDPLNRAELYSHQARLLTDIDQQVDGNIFIALFTSSDGRVSPRSLPTDEIRDIIKSDEDHAQVLFYRRVWASQKFDPERGTLNIQEKEAYYPDWRFQPTSKAASISGKPVYWDAPVIHQKTGGLKTMRFGVPETYAALDWARAYRKFLEDWHTIVASLARFAWQKTTKGRKIKKAKDKLQSTITSDDPIEQNKAPGAGSVHVSAEGDELTPIPKTGAHTSADDAKPSRLMVASAMDLPDTILSNDPQQGALATAQTLDRPTELMISSRQQMWRDFEEDKYSYAIAVAIKRRLIPKSKSDTEVKISYPPILEHDMADTVNAIVAAATLQGKADAGTIPREELVRALLETLGFDDVEDIIQKLDPEAQQMMADAVSSLQDLAKKAGLQGEPTPPGDEPVPEPGRTRGAS